VKKFLERDSCLRGRRSPKTLRARYASSERRAAGRSYLHVLKPLVFNAHYFDALRSDAEL
jgi:hypothetical protein